MALTHIDCFSGPGGICTGLHAAGFDTRVAIEYIESCVETYSANHPNVHIIHSDIRNVKKEDILPSGLLVPCSQVSFSFTALYLLEKGNSGFLRFMQVSSLLWPSYTIISRLDF